ncbi:hypothetical protein FPV16_00625 [Methylobacterium sp. W2]|uniref:hypothetical protein n=1 Tax=Methylobacterium sp. W2 TaxID=2598107 RepID=UPI001D0C4B7C|nr:hypothetical protein [Methylobacterium sp. W2]MCC0804736.1 hypothetical protein [Methylobacterium sp. W2]
MSVVRRFLVAPSLVRLIRKERGSSKITEGYFAPQAGRTSYVRVDGQNCHLVLVTTAPDGSSSEERTDVPRAHGDALLDVCSGKAIYDRAVMALGNGREAFVDRYATPGALDLLSVVFDEPGQAAAFVPPAWFGEDVSENTAYDRHAVAIQGVPQTGEVALSNAALEAILDLLEPRFGFGRFNAPPPKAVEDEAALRANRRATAQAAKAAAPAAVPVEEPAPQPVAEERSEERREEPATEETPTAEAPIRTDARIDDVIESLSQALGASQPSRAAGRNDDPAAEFERWTVRPRRTPQT